METWPNDADGDVFRSLDEQGFDFSKEYIIDFNIDFETDDVPEEAFVALGKIYPGADVIDKTSEDPPYIQIQIRSRVNYEFVIQRQAELTREMKLFGGWCESWGILH